MELVPESVAVEPGTVRCLEAHVRNTGSGPCQLVLDVAGEAAQWAWLHPQSCDVGPGEEAVISVVLKPPCAPQPSAGVLQFGIRATCRGEPELSAMGQGVLDIQPFADVVAALDPVIGRDRRTFVYTLKLENRGNVGMRATLSADEPSGHLVLGVEPMQVSAGPGETATANVHVEARKGMFRRGEQRFPICVRARVEGGAELRADGAFYQQGRGA